MRNLPKRGSHVRIVLEGNEQVLARKVGRRSGNIVTIHDVARHVGVSPMTVSRVINGEKNVREETRAKVMASVEALNYSPISPPARWPPRTRRASACYIPTLRSPSSANSCWASCRKAPRTAPNC